jgi:hypothetical protein
MTAKEQTRPRGRRTRAIRSFADVLALWTPLQLSRVLNVPYSTAKAMHWRGLIGPAHWARLIEAATACGEIVTADMLIKFADDRRSHASKDQRRALARWKAGRHKGRAVPPPLSPPPPDEEVRTGQLH